MSTPFTVALVGNPNTGKTTLFNALSGARERVGNWSGVTVDRAETETELDGQTVRWVDLPGIFTLAAHTPDERVTRDFVASGQAHLVLNVLDAANLERSLCLTKQLLDMRLPLVVALNFVDVARRRGLQVDATLLAQSLGCPVTPVVAPRGEGIPELADVLAQAVRRHERPRDMAPPAPPRDFEEKNLASEERLAFARGLARAVVLRTNRSRESLADRVDGILLNTWAGMPLFFAVMYAVFWLTVQATQPLTHFIDRWAGAFLVHGPRAGLDRLGMHPAAIAILTDGVGAGLAAVATFIPPIFAIFVCLGLLEGSGYMPRATFVMDRLMRHIGLPGKAFIPLLVGFGCTVPATLATRTLEQRRDRLLTMLIAPFMSCGARLPVYTIFALAFFPRSGNQVVFSLYVCGILLAVLSGLLLHRTVLPGVPAAYVLELPPYHLPPLRLCLDHAWFNLRSFLFRAGKVIVGVAVGLSLLKVADEAWMGSRGRNTSSEGLVALAGRAVTPVFMPMGVSAENWPASVGLLTGLLAKESVIGTLDVLYTQAGAKRASGGAEQAFDLKQELRQSLRELGEGYGLIAASPDATGQGAWLGMLSSLRQAFDSGAAAFAYLLFVLTYSPCFAALAVLAREAGWRWMAFSLSYQTLLAWMVATAFYQAATFHAHAAASTGWLALILALALLVFLFLRRFGRRLMKVEAFS